MLSTDRLSGTAAILSTVFALSACSRPAAPRATERPPEPTPTPHAWVIDVTSAKATTKTSVGGEMFITVVVENTGKAASDTTELQLSDIDKYADVVECTPDCTIDRGLGGGYYLSLPGVPAGKEKTYKVELVPTKIGAAHWGVCVYDDVDFGDQVACYEGTVTIR